MITCILKVKGISPFDLAEPNVSFCETEPLSGEGPVHL